MVIRERYVKKSPEGHDQQWCELECDECHSCYELRRRGLRLNKQHLCSKKCLSKFKARVALQMTQRWNEKTRAEKDEILEKKRKSYVAHYGVDHPFKAPEVRKRIAETCLERYGVENAASSPAIKAKMDQKSMHAKGHQTRKTNGSYARSKAEDKFHAALCAVNGEDNVERQVIVNGWSIDFHVKSLDLYVQFDGVHWHGLDRPIEVIKGSTRSVDRVIASTWERDRAQKAWFEENSLRLVRVTDVQFKRSAKLALSMVQSAGMKNEKSRDCICEEGDPCDYHAATCVVCRGGCKGHPAPKQSSEPHHVAIDSRPDIAK